MPIFARILTVTLNGLIIPSDDRVRVGCTLLHLSHEHYNSINILIETKMFGSAFALARPLFEAYIRGLWILDCASDTQRNKYMKGEVPNNRQLLDEIKRSQNINNADSWLDKNYNTNIKKFHDLTHGGVYQVIRRNTIEGIESNYPIDEQIRLLIYSGEVAIQATVQFFAIAEQELLLTELKEKATSMRLFWSENLK